MGFHTKNYTKSIEKQSENKSETIQSSKEIQKLLKQLFIKARACQYPRYQSGWTDSRALQSEDLVNSLTVITCETFPPEKYWELCYQVLLIELVKDHGVVPFIEGWRKRSAE